MVQLPPDGIPIAIPNSLAVQVAVDHAQGHKILKYAMYNQLEEMRELVMQDPRAILAKEVAPLSLCAANACAGLSVERNVLVGPVWVTLLFISDVKGTFIGMSEWWNSLPFSPRSVMLVCNLDR